MTNTMDVRSQHSSAMKMNQSIGMSSQKSEDREQNFARNKLRLGPAEKSMPDDLDEMQRRRASSKSKVKID